MPGRTLRVVLDTCILKLATFPGENNASALIYELARAGFVEAWVTPAIPKSTRMYLAIIQSSSLKLSRTFPCVIR